MRLWHAAYSTTVRPLTLGIRKEAKNRWECRVPLAPSHILQLKRDLPESSIIVQPSSKRVFPDDAYAQAGAVISDDLSQADVILGVKEVPKNELLADKTYVFFSHTHKGQPYNMPMLRDILEKRITLIDYELFVNKNRQRLVVFGKFAGYAGILNGMHGLGDRLLSLGYNTPFIRLGLAHHYSSLDHAKKAVRDLGQMIYEDGLPKSLGPIVFTFTGTGNVSQGAQEIFRMLPHQWVPASELPRLFAKPDSYDPHTVYGCVVMPEDYLAYNGKFDVADYFAQPQKYTSLFHEKVAPFTTMLINGIYWDQRYPRLLTRAHAKSLIEQYGSNRLITVADISCDIEGSLEFMNKASTIDAPFYFYDVQSGSYHEKLDGPGIQIMSIDNLPTQLPKEASLHFGDSLLPHIKALIQGDYTNPVIHSATIARRGVLQPPHEKLKDHMDRVLESARRKRILLLGSGFVAAPLVDYFARSNQYEMTIASNNLEEAKRLARDRSSIKISNLDVHDSASLKSLVSNHDIVVSFVPASLHPIVAAACIDERRHMVTASYVSPSLMEFDAKAKAADITMLNEIGLDPGIDHLTAMRIIEEAKANKAKITSFVSWCGGLPAPEHSDNPLGYKFSWSPRGVLLATLNDARFLRDGKIIEIPGKELLASAAEVPIYPGFRFEGIPNRDSLKYLEAYGLQGVQTMFRGTLRYKGFCELMKQFVQLGFLDVAPVQWLSPSDTESLSWSQFSSLQLNIAPDASVQDRLAALSSKTGIDSASAARLYQAMEWLDMWSKEPVTKSITRLDSFCSLLQRQLAYASRERDLVCLHHEFRLEYEDGRKELRTSTLVDYGVVNGYSAMAKTVALPAAIAAELILNGSIKDRGVLAPMRPSIYVPILQNLEKEGITCVERTVVLQ